MRELRDSLPAQATRGMIGFCRKPGQARLKQAGGAARPVRQFVALMSPTHSPMPLPATCEYSRGPMSESR